MCNMWRSASASPVHRGIEHGMIWVWREPYTRQIPASASSWAFCSGGGDASLLAQKACSLFLEVLQLQQVIVPAPF